MFFSKDSSLDHISVEVPSTLPVIQARCDQNNVLFKIVAVSLYEIRHVYSYRPPHHCACSDSIGNIGAYCFRPPYCNQYLSLTIYLTMSRSIALDRANGQENVS